jgi:hypothetical protein
LLAAALRLGTKKVKKDAFFRTCGCGMHGG